MSLEPHLEKPTILRVGLCQTYTEEWNVVDNTQRLMADIEKAAMQGAELIITPECVFNGYAGPGSEDWRARFPVSTETLEGERVGMVRALARQYHVDIVLGFAERVHSGQFFNTAVLIGKTGETIFTYRKVHCRDFESVEHTGVFTPGDGFYVSSREYQEDSFSIGIMICFDREIPETVRCLRALGAELIACPLATNTSREDSHEYGSPVNNELITRARAAENEIYIAVVNHAGRFNGGSYIVGPRGEILCKLGKESQVKVVEVPLDCVSKDFHSKPYNWMGWGFRRPEIYSKYLENKIP